MLSPVHPQICLDLAAYGTDALKQLCQEILFNMLDGEIETGEIKLYFIVLTQTGPRLQRICMQHEWTGRKLSSIEEMEPKITQLLHERLTKVMSEYLVTEVENDYEFLNSLIRLVEKIADDFEELLISEVIAT